MLQVGTAWCKPAASASCETYEKGGGFVAVVAEVHIVQSPPVAEIGQPSHGKNVKFVCACGPSPAMQVDGVLGVL